MEKNAIISVKSEMTSAGERDVIELTTDGSYYISGGEHHIHYDECSDREVLDINTHITATADKVTLSRSGAVKSTINLDNGQRHISQYELPEGSLMLCVHTKQIQNNLRADGGVLKMKYNIEINGAEETSNFITITVRNKQIN